MRIIVVIDGKVSLRALQGRGNLAARSPRRCSPRDDKCKNKKEIIYVVFQLGAWSRAGMFIRDSKRNVARNG